LQEKYDRDINEARRFTSILSSSNGATEQVEQLRLVINSLESKLINLQSELTVVNNRNSQMDFELNKRDIELQDVRKKLNESQETLDFRSTAKP
jgi:predicted nuclease with TOPRIM domain